LNKERTATGKKTRGKGDREKNNDNGKKKKETTKTSSDKARPGKNDSGGEKRDEDGVGGNVDVTLGGARGQIPPNSEGPRGGGMVGMRARVPAETEYVLPFLS
jgi:hypothetical protein